MRTVVATNHAPDSVVALIRACDRLARHAVIVADLRRSPFAGAGFAVGARLLRFDPCTRADGHTSIRRGYTEPEFRTLLARAGVAASVRRVAPWRLAAAWRTAH